MSNIHIDCYGFKRVPGENYLVRDRRPYQCIESSDGKAIFVRHTMKENCPIWKIDSMDGTIRWTFGAWTDREILTYTIDTNTLLEIDENLLM